MKILSIDGKELWSDDKATIKESLEAAVKARADLDGADLNGAYLAGANLDGANLAGANLAGAYLDGADLNDACLAGANLAGADLAGANLAGANLAGANLAGAYLDGADLNDACLAGANLAGADLDGADLDGADLAGAKLSDDTILQYGDKWIDYREKIVPALLTAGGVPLAQVASEWECHTWENCPMARAFNVHSERDCPPLLRPRVREFVMWYDAKQLQKPVAKENA
jgi:hypothetical protein